ncbi:hypothetical protein OAL00_00675 [Verrucomicrobiales bacterium]|nr:hypothetical protein [Verrucomicrobiales bacterium]
MSENENLPVPVELPLTITPTNPALTLQGGNHFRNVEAARAANLHAGDRFFGYKSIQVSHGNAQRLGGFFDRGEVRDGLGFVHA